MHFELSRIVGEAAVSPVRVHTEAGPSPEEQMPLGYELYSGHLDWPSLDHLGPDRFVFTVLRDPRERIASFYFYLLQKAKNCSADALEDSKSQGLRRVMNWSTDRYFADEDPVWQKFILDHYDNFYTTYFASRRIRGRALLEGLSPKECQIRAQNGLDELDAVYEISDLKRLERDILRVRGQEIKVVGRYANASRDNRSDVRWPLLLARLEKDSTRHRLESFVERDLELSAGYKDRKEPRRWPWFSRSKDRGDTA